MHNKKEMEPKSTSDREPINLDCSNNSLIDLNIDLQQRALLEEFPPDCLPVRFWFGTY